MSPIRHALPLVLAAGLAAGLASPALAQSALTPRAPALLFHGNYCGPGNNAPLPPVDALDRACAHHDACTRTGHLSSAACNARLQREADAVSRDPRQPEDLRALAGLVAVGAGLLPSAPPGNETHRYATTITGGRAPVADGPRFAPPVLPGDEDDGD